MLRKSSLSFESRSLVLGALVGFGAATSLVGCVSQPKKDDAKTERKSVQNLVVDSAPEDIQKLDVDFDGKIKLLGYKLDAKGEVKPGDKIKYTLYWKSEQPLQDKGYRLFTHVFDGSRKRLLNIDRVGGLRQSQLIPSTWEPGKVYVDEQSFTVPKGVSGSKVQVVSGFFKDATRLKIRKGAQLGADGALVLTIPVKGDRVAAWKPPTLRVDRLDKGTTLKIDGKLDEKAWETAPSTGAFVNVGTGKRDPSQAVQGSARVLWDDQALYVAFEVTDKDVVGGFEKGAVDPHLWTKDTVEIMVDPDGDGDNKDYYEIQVNPQNLVFDSRFDDYNAPKGGPKGPFGHQEWSAKLQSAVVVNGTLDEPGDADQGYVVEIAIPWSSFDKAKHTPPRVGDTWRLNFYAMQNNGGVAWSPILGKGNFHKASQFGRVLFAERGWQPAPPAPSAAASGATATTATNSTVPTSQPRPVVPPVNAPKVNSPKPTPQPAAPKP